MTDDEIYDVIVVGGGAAGLSAALVLGRARRRVAVVDGGQPRNAPASGVHGFLSRDGMPPAELLATGRAELDSYGVDLIDAQVEHLAAGFEVKLTAGPVLRSRRVIVATGLRDELPDIPGVRQRWGIDVLHCPYCHGWEVRDTPIAVLGSAPMSVHQALLVKKWSPDTVFLPHTMELSTADRHSLDAWGVQVIDGEVTRLVVEQDRLRGIEIADGSLVQRGTVFVAPRVVGRDTLLTGLGCERDAGGWVVTDPNGLTSIDGVWAVGNVIDQRAQVVVAAAQGSSAATAADRDLLAEEVAHATETAA